MKWGLVGPAAGLWRQYMKQGRDRPVWTAGSQENRNGHRGHGGG